MPGRSSKTTGYDELPAYPLVVKAGVVGTGGAFDGESSLSTLATTDSAFSSNASSSPRRSNGALQCHLMSSLENICQLEAFASVGQGPMRFGPACKGRSIQEDLRNCSSDHAQQFIRIKLACDFDAKLKKSYTDEQIFRVATYKDFSVSKTLSLLRKMDIRYMNTTCKQLEEQLRTQTLFPLPRVQSETIESFFYLRPSRYQPSQTPTLTILANLIYVMDTLYERHRDYEHNKMGIIANMEDWTMGHFSVDDYFQIMQALQGRLAPVHVDLFLIVNPPRWFGRVWHVIKPMLSSGFRRKVHMIPEEKLGRFLQPGFAKYLPDELKCGKAVVPDLVDDFITFRKHVEESSVDHRASAFLMGHSKLCTWAPISPRRDRKSNLARQQQQKRRLNKEIESVASTKGLPKSSRDKLVRESSWFCLEAPWEATNATTTANSATNHNRALRQPVNSPCFRLEE